MTSSRFVTQAKKNKNKTQLSVIVPVAGMGHRMKSYGPKCLLSANKKHSIVEQAIENITEVYPFAEIMIVVGFEADRVIKTLPKKVRIVENQIYETTNVVESLRLALNNSTTDSVLVVYGDLIFNESAIEGLDGDCSCAVIDSKRRFKDEEIGVTVVDDKITNFAYGLETKWAQIIYLTGNELKLLKEFCFDRKKNKMYPFEIFNMIIDKGGLIKTIENPDMKIREIDSLKDL